MNKLTHGLTAAVGIMSLTTGLSLSHPAWAATSADMIESGKQVAFDRKKGNCLACHAIEGGTLTGNIAPPLVAMQARFPDKAKLRAQIYDATRANPYSVMPPFGRHRILSEEEIDLVTEFVYSL